MADAPVPPAADDRIDAYLTLHNVPRNFAPTDPNLQLIQEHKRLRKVLEQVQMTYTNPLPKISDDDLVGYP